MGNQVQLMLVPVVKIDLFKNKFFKTCFILGDLDESGDYEDDEDDNSEEDGRLN